MSSSKWIDIVFSTTPLPRESCESILLEYLSPLVHITYNDDEKLPYTVELTGIGTSRPEWIEFTPLLPEWNFSLPLIEPWFSSYVLGFTIFGFDGQQYIDCVACGEKGQSEVVVWKFHPGRWN